jgi:modulator of FtsH protease
MTRYDSTLSLPVSTTVATNKLIKNTYILLALTLLFSAFTAGLSMTFGWSHPGLLITLVGYFGLLFLTERFKNSALGLLFVFALTGFMGLTLGPIISAYISTFSNGSQLVMTAMGGTGVIFLALSGYALVSRKDFSFMGGFLMVGILVAFLAGLGAFIFQIPALAMAVSAMFILLMSALILYQTSAMVNGGETNYISATITLYIAIYNLFTSLLQLLGIFGGED